jgi:hypothetical protein
MKYKLSYLQGRRASQASNQQEAGGKQCDLIVENQVQMGH